jgi:hypothetical protein
MRFLKISLCVAMFLSSPLAAQEGATAPAHTATPEAVAQAYLDAIVEGGLTATGAFFAPEALGDLKEAFVPLLELEAAQGQANLRGLMFDAGQSLEQIQALSPADFYNGVMRFLEVQMGQAQVSFSGGEVLGTVMEGEDLAHVVTRMAIGIGEGSAKNMEILSMQRVEGGGWALLLQGEIRQMMEAIRAQVEAAEAAQAAAAAQAAEAEGAEAEGEAGVDP